MNSFPWLLVAASFAALKLLLLPLLLLLQLLLLLLQLRKLLLLLLLLQLLLRLFLVRQLTVLDIAFFLTMVAYVRGTAALNLLVAVSVLS